MPGFDERLKQHLERLAPPADPSGAFDRILEKKIRRRLVRRFQAAALAVLVVVATVGGTFALVQVFRSNGEAERLGGINPTPVPVKNGLIAYASRQSGNWDIWTARPDGTRADNITADSLSDDTDPAWSPDGTKIAFSSAREGNMEIYVMSGEGEGLDATRLTRNSGPDEDPAWSPDGTKIAYISSGDLFVMNADGSQATTLTAEREFVRHPTWAPDGSMIAFSSIQPKSGSLESGDDNSPGIHLIDPDGSDFISLTEAGLGDWPDWSPDGRKIVFTRAGDIYVMNNDGSGVTKLTRNNNIEAFLSAEPAWSPDGRRIVFHESSAVADSDGIELMNPDGSGVVPTGIPETASVVAAPDWQPIPISNTPPPSSPSLTSTPSPLPAECDASQMTGDFDGNARPDTATVAKTECFVQPGDQGERFSTEYSLQVRWPPSVGIAPLPDCGNVCQALAATDLNLDGIDEFILKVDEGSSSYGIQVYELPASEAFGDPAETTPPGGPGFPPDQAAQFGVGGTVTAFAALGCPGNNEIIVEIAKLDLKQTEYAVHKTVLRFDPIDAPPFGHFTVVSTRDYKEPFDNEVGPGDRFEPGGPCWMDEPSP